MKNKIIIAVLMIGIVFINACRPDDSSIQPTTDLSIFDYNFNAFITQKNDTVRTQTWVPFELYYKPNINNKIKSPNPKISLIISSSKDVKFKYRVYKIDKGTALDITPTVLIGDEIVFKSTDLIDDKILLGIIAYPPSEIGSFELTIKTSWQGVDKTVTKPISVIN